MVDIATIDPGRRRRRRKKDFASIAKRKRFAIDAQTLIDADGRLRVVRRLKDIASQIVNSDQGGADRCSEVKLQLIRRFSTCCVLAETEEAKLARGEELDVERFAVITSVLCRLSNRIGLTRVPKQIEGLGSYLEREYAARPEPEPLEPESHEPEPEEAL
jgi:hypothetical protein